MSKPSRPSSASANATAPPTSAQQRLQIALVSRRVWASLVNRIKAGDKLEFDNQQLLAVIRQQQTFSKAQLETLLDSPLTLRRYRHLLAAEQRQSDDHS
ncbi:MAG: hypothetical protein OIF57_02110 [Marinobacterium sp.]|nr:hypothetical protein [Marinobacterium sp.]